MSIFPDQEFKRIERKAKTQAFFNALFHGLGAIFFTGWVFFLVYAAMRPDAWPYIGLWTAFGIAYLVRYAVNLVRGMV